MSSASVICQNCKNKFVIESDDFAFYERIKVPPPTFCFECRNTRRLAFRNELNLYKRKCGAPGHSEEILSIYSPDKNLVVYDQKFWWSDGWDPMQYGRNYDFSKPFFEQYLELRNQFPLMSVSNSNATNSDYCNVADQSKDCYLISGSFTCERTFYSNRVGYIKDSSDLYVAHRNELCYDSSHISDCYRVLFSRNCVACSDSWFLYDCRNCQDCFGCTNLRSKSHCVFNEQYTKEGYAEKLKGLNIGSFKEIERNRELFKERYNKAIHKFANILKSADVTGDNIENVKNCKFAFDIADNVEDSKYIHWGGYGSKDAYDSGPGVGMVSLAYEMFDTGIGGSENFFTSVVYGSNDVRYAFNCYSCSHLFGCIGLRGKEYCILNKQYSKEEYERLVPKIIEHMNSMPYLGKQGRNYRYGEFFPVELSPFAYNETVANDYYPHTKEQALAYGYLWKEPEKNSYKTTIAATALPDTIDGVTDAILGEVIECAHKGECNDQCAAAFKITPAELQLYRVLKVPLPRLCFKCRHYRRLRERKPMKLWHRQCMCDMTNHSHEERCANEFETSYSPERKEIVYCEQCYQAEVV